jgi:hypothetical protein
MSGDLFSVVLVFMRCRLLKANCTNVQASSEGPSREGLSRRAATREFAGVGRMTPRPSGIWRSLSCRLTGSVSRLVPSLVFLRSPCAESQDGVDRTCPSSSPMDPSSIRALGKALKTQLQMIRQACVSVSTVRFQAALRRRRKPCEISIWSSDESSSGETPQALCCYTVRPQTHLGTQCYLPLPLLLAPMIHRRLYQASCA